MDLTLVPLHKYKNYTEATCKLINEEWKRSDTARMHSLESSCDNLPTSLILLQNNKVIGHLKLTAIPTIPDGCFLESVVIDRELRGQGLGRELMKQCEDYCRNLKLKTIYLSTKGQEQFYKKLGYNECSPISIYGCFTVKDTTVENSVRDQFKSAPIPPPLPTTLNIPKHIKTHMRKELN